MARRRLISLRDAIAGLLVGALLGLAAWQTRDLLDAAHKDTPRVAIGLTKFVQLAPLGESGGANEPRLTDVVVHPAADGKQLVTCRELNGTSRDPNREFVAAVPFVVPPPEDDVVGVAAKTFSSVREFLDRYASATKYRYAWWEDSRFQSAVWVGAPAILLCMLVPLGRWLLLRLGLITMPEVVADPEPPMTAFVAVESPAATSTPAPPEETPFAPPPAEATTYDGGVYYPVHRPKSGERE